MSDLESAIVATLAPGRYTAVLAGKNGTAGNGLAEVYDLEPGTSSTLANLSTRGFVGAGDNAMIGGVIIGNGDSPIVVLRAIGPTLTSSGIANPLLDPTIELHDGNGAVIGLNDNWKDGQLQAVQATQLAPTDDRESAIVAFLAPGNYTAVVRGKGDTTGVALVEAYRVRSTRSRPSSALSLDVGQPARERLRSSLGEGGLNASTSSLTIRHSPFIVRRLRFVLRHS